MCLNRWAVIADAVVIGGGVIGLSIALELATRGVRVTVLDRGTPGGEASSAAAGMLAPQLEAEHARPILELGLASRAMYPHWVAAIEARTGVATGFSVTGGVTLLTTEEAVTRAWELAGQADLFIVIDCDLRTIPMSFLPSVPLSRGVPLVVLGGTPTQYDRYAKLVTRDPSEPLLVALADLMCVT